MQISERDAPLPSLLELMGVEAATPPIVRPDDDHYRSPPECLRALASVVDLSAGIWECCAGDGIQAATAADLIGADAVLATSIHPPAVTYHPVEAADFLKVQQLRRRNIVTNPPYSMLYGKRLPKAGAATRIVRHALELLTAAGDDGGALCLLLDLRFSLSEIRNEPGGLLHEFPPTVIHAFADRVTMYPAGAGGGKPLQGGTAAFAWFVWEGPPYRRPGADTPLRRVLNSRAFRQPDDVARFGLPIIKGGRRRRADHQAD
ncbi:hypothetical protein ACHMW5_35950 (plasmid) [Azospirillum melinis]|uniref:hypothetical protein n=1 Tax=Azospirillum melinis TaxID=328839 RepID=UPI003756BDE8